MAIALSRQIVKITRQLCPLPLAPFKTGQVYALKDSNIVIGEVGKTLVFYKHIKNSLKRAPVSLAAKAVLEKYLQDNHAGLVEA